MFFILLFFAVISYLAGAYIGTNGVIKQFQSGMFYGFSFGCFLIFVFEVIKIASN